MQEKTSEKSEKLCTQIPESFLAWSFLSWSHSERCHSGLSRSRLGRSGLGRSGLSRCTVSLDCSFCVRIEINFYCVTYLKAFLCVIELTSFSLSLSMCLLFIENSVSMCCTLQLQEKQTCTVQCCWFFCIKVAFDWPWKNKNISEWNGHVYALLTYLSLFP
jgi:hypothetical protein